LIALEALADTQTLLVLVLALVIAGAAVGFLAGLFGVGGGAISVPVFYEIFLYLGYGSEVAMPLAVGTSLAVILPTSISSARGHHARGTVDVALLKLWAAPVVAGVLVGAVIARFADPKLFQAVFIAVRRERVKLLSGARDAIGTTSLAKRVALYAPQSSFGAHGHRRRALTNLVMTCMACRSTARLHGAAVASYRIPGRSATWPPAGPPTCRPTNRLRLLHLRPHHTSALRAPCVASHAFRAMGRIRRFLIWACYFV